MNKLSILALAALALASASASALQPSGAAPSAAVVEDPGYATYRRVVLGDTSVEVPAKANAKLADQGSRLVPGSYALYLTRNGMPEAEAIAQAQRAGEQPRLVIAARQTPVQLSAYEQYQRSVLGTPEREIVNSRESQPLHRSASSETQRPNP